MSFPLGAQSVGDILDRGLKVLFGRMLTFYAICLIVLSPIIAVQLALPAIQVNVFGPTPFDVLRGFILGNLAILFLTIILKPLAVAATLHIINQEFLGQRAGLGEAFRFALARFGRLFLASLLTGLLFAVGFFLCCIPAIVVTVWCAFVAQVVVVENLSAEGALPRSMRLTAGYRWRILGLFVLMFIATMIVESGLVFLSVFFPGAETVMTESGFTYIVHPGMHLLHVTAQNLVNILMESYSAVCLTLFYFDLRIRKEGYDLELAAQRKAAVLA
jgi:hypothetical protein